MSSPSPSSSDRFVVTLVGAMRAQGGRPAGTLPDAPSWGAVADRSRLLALGLEAAGIEQGNRVHVDPAGLHPHDLVERELAVLAAGAVLVADGDGGDIAMTAGSLVADTETPLDQVRDRGRAIDADSPGRFETRLQALEPDAPALDMGGTTVSSAGACWALRCVHRWIGGVVADPGPVLGVGRGGAVHPHSLALLERWWPASIGAPLVSAAGEPDVIALIRSAVPAVIVGDAGRWNELVEVVRSAAARSRGGRALLRRGRLVEGGESERIGDRLGVARGRRRQGPIVRSAAGLDRLVLGVCLGALDPVTGRDLAATGVPVAATWLEPGVLAPLAAGSVVRPRPSSPWGRLLPGRTIKVDADRTVVLGGDIAGAATLRRRVQVDARSRALIPRVASVAGSLATREAR